MNPIIKTTKQIEGIKKSCLIASKTLKFVESFLQPGITTDYINNLVEKFIRDHGAIPATLGYKGFPKSCCTSVNEVVCHGIPDEYILKEGDIISVDVTTILDGYYGDTAATFGIGKISKEAEHLINVAKKCLEIGIKSIKPYRKIGEIGYNIYKYALINNCTVVEEFCGHGVGLEFHEPPQILHICDKDYGIMMKPGMIFTCEPMINLGLPDIIIDQVDSWTVRTVDKSLSAQFEHTILVNDTGFEILT